MWFLVAVMRGFVLLLPAIWDRVGFVDKCWHMSLCSLLVCATIWGFRPSPLFCLRVAGKNGAPFAPYWVGWGHKKLRRGGLSCAGMEYFEALMLRYGGMSAPACPNGLSKRLSCRFSLGLTACVFRVLVGATRKAPWWGCSPGGLLIT